SPVSGTCRRGPLPSSTQTSARPAARPGRDQSKLAQLAETATGSLTSSQGGEDTRRKRHVGGVGDRRPQRIYGSAGWRLNLTKLACQPGIVISFYDLSRPVPGHRSALHGRIPHRIISAWGDSLSTRPKGLCPQPPGAAPAEPLVTAVKNVL